MAKRKKDYLPKRVGRLKIPKRIRRGLVGALISSAAGQAVIAALILKAGAHLTDRVSARRDPWDEDWFEADGVPAAYGDPDQGGSTARPASDPQVPQAPPGPTLNVKHALSDAALAFVLGLSHPKRPKRGRHRRPVARSRAPATSPGANGARPSASGGGVAADGGGEEGIGAPPVPSATDP